MRKIAILIIDVADGIIYLWNGIGEGITKCMKFLDKRKERYSIYFALIFILISIGLMIIKIFNSENQSSFSNLMIVLIILMAFVIFFFLSKILVERFHPGILDNYKSPYNNKIRELDNFLSNDIENSRRDELNLGSESILRSQEDSKEKNQDKKDFTKDDFYEFFPDNLFEELIEPLLIKENIIFEDGRWNEDGKFPNKINIYVLLTKFHMLKIKDLKIHGNQSKILRLAEVYFQSSFDNREFGKVLNMFNDNSIELKNNPHVAVFNSLSFLDSISKTVVKKIA